MHSVLVVLVASTVAFLLLHLAPGDPISAIADANNVPTDVRAQWRAQQGYNRPLAVQYVDWLGHVARGDFGESTSQHRPVIAVIGERLPRTLLLMSVALAASLGLGLAIGNWQGTRSGTRADRALSFVMLMVYAVPEFLIGLGLLWLLVLQWHWPLPASGIYSVDRYEDLSFLAQLGDRLKHMVLPVLSLTAVGVAVFARYQRAAVREALALPFVRTARAKGLAESQVRAQVHRVALPPMVTLTGLFFPTLLTGAVFVERIYGWHGLGDALLNAITTRDYALVSACVILGSAMTALGSLLADAGRAWLDPRLGAVPS